MKSLVQIWRQGVTEPLVKQFDDADKQEEFLKQLREDGDALQYTVYVEQSTYTKTVKWEKTDA